MHRLQRQAPLDATPVIAPPEADRMGTPLIQGYLLTLVATVAAEHCDPEVLAVLGRIDPDAWYPGPLLETILCRLEDRDPELPGRVGRSVHFVWRGQLDAIGLRSAAQLLEAMPALWRQATRGASGEWRAVVGPGRAHLELAQPFHCLFAAGTVRGLLEACGASNVRVAHAPCMRGGAAFCGLDVRWEEPNAVAVR